MDLKAIFPNIEFQINANPNIDGFIDVKFRLIDDDPILPIDLAGTGILQATQIAAYVNYFQPSLLLLDEYNHIKDGDLKYIILTEDSSMDSRKYLRGVLEASGYARDEFQIYSYNSVSRIDSAKMFASFLLDINPDLTVIIYRDRDGLYDSEIAYLKAQIEFDSRVKCVIAHFNDIEMYYCNAEHIKKYAKQKDYL